MNKRQRTLFDTWNKVPSSQNRSNPPVNQQNIVRYTNDNGSSNLSNSDVFQPCKYSRTIELENPEFDYEAGKTWIYPTNYPIRDYQFSIVKEALFKNTLVVLPTGLGKTFIAAVVMYNIYRWYPNGKVVFMAPTKPLVAQQVDACFKITGISQDDTTQMTGTNAPELRKKMWLRKRVFFLTPQVLVNDLIRNICPPSSIKCLVVDEAHKALGNHAYCQVVKELCNYTSHFRVLALTATPGSEIQSVKQVLRNLLISHVEIRSEDSEDVQQYTHIRDLEKVIVPLGDKLNMLKSKFLDVINIYLKRLTLHKVMTPKNPASLSKFQILKLRETFSQHPPTNIDKMTYGLAMADFSLCISLYHAYELLLLHGATSFYNFLTGILNGEKSIPHARSELLKNFEFKEIMQEIKENYIPEQTNPNLEGQNLVKQKSILPGHPKLEKLLEVVLNHFKRANKENISDTRVMIFTQYRDSVQEIVRMFNQYQPIVKVMSFIGQSSKSIINAGYSQKQQLKVIQQFRSGGYNTLVSTCVGEEGLDIGEVDLIVCFDCPKSPIRLVQRMGRTGRLRKGHIIILITEGKEEQMYNNCEYRKRTIHRAIEKGFSFAQFYQNSPPIIPNGVKPVCVKTTITIEPKKALPKTVTKSPYLTKDEIVEYEKHVKTSKSDAPLFPKRECVILKRSSEKVFEDKSCDISSVKPQFSLSEWTLWQSTPQRTHFIPHSSKSLLLPKILEYIHFPELTSTNTSLNLSCVSDSSNKTRNPSVYEEFYTSFKQSKITDLLSTSKMVKDFQKHDVVNLISPEKEINTKHTPVSKSINAKTGLPLLQQLFNIYVPQNSNFSNNCLILSPPSVCLANISDFSSAVENSDKLSNKIHSILFVLNKKMKAKIKRKSKELCQNLTFISHLKKLSTPTKRTSISPTHLENDYNNSAFDISFDIPFHSNIYPKSNLKQSSIFNEKEELKTMSFDIDFDFPDDTDFDTESKYDTKSASNKDFGVYEINNIELGISMCPKTEETNKITYIRNDHKFAKSTINTCIISQSSSNKNISSNLCHFETDLQETNIQNESEDLYNANNVILSSSSGNNYKTENFQKTCALNECSMSNKCAINSLVSKSNTSNLAISSVQQFQLKNSELQNKNIEYLQELNETDSFQNNLSNYNLNKISYDLNPSPNPAKIQLSFLENVNTIDTICDFDQTLEVSEKFNSCVELKGIDLDPLCVTMKEAKLSEKNKIGNNSGEHHNQFEIALSVEGNKEVEMKKLPDLQISSSDISKEDILPKTSVITNKLEEFDEDANSIVEQLFTSQKSVSSNIECSFSSPLILKRCISQTEDNEKKILMNCKKYIKTSKNTFKSPNTLSKSLFKIPSVQDITSTTDEFSSKQNFNSKIGEKIEESSQYSITQLLSLIDCTGKLEKKSKNSPRIIQNYSDIVSSEDEVCPTPPKEEIKTKSKFVYNKKTPVRKSLAFDNFVKMNNDHPTHDRNILNVTPSPSSVLKLSMSQINSMDHCVEINQRNRLDKYNSITTKQITDKNETTLGDIESQQMDKITFDISFDLPFTQENLDISTKNESFDLNKAIYIEGSSNENQLDESLSNDIKLVNYFEPKNNNSNSELGENILKNLNSDKSIYQMSISDHLIDEITFENSESLLPAKKIEGYNDVDSFTTEIHKNDLINQENIQIKEQSIDKSYTSEKNANSSFSNVLEENCFHSTISYELSSINSPKDKYDIADAKSLSNFNKGKKKGCIDSLLIDKKSVDIKQNVIHSNSHSAQDKLSDPSDSQSYVNKEPKFIFSNRSFVKQCLDSINVNETSSEMIPAEDKILLSKKKLVFDLEDNDDETCGLLPNVISTITEIDSEKKFIRNSKVENRNICSTMISENLANSKPVTKIKNIEESKNKNLNFKSVKTCDISPDKQLCSEKSSCNIYTKSNKNMNEFELNKVESSVDKISNHKNMSSFYEVSDNCKVLDDRDVLSDESDFYDEQKSSIKLKKQYQELKSSKSCIENYNIASKELCSPHKDNVNIKNKFQATKDKSNKLSSKLSVRNRTKSQTKNILKNNTSVEEDEEAFQFIRKLDKKPDILGNKKRKRNVISDKNEFLLSQAEVSSGEVSDWESDADDDNILRSFINDESPEKMDYTDKHAFYLRSLKNSYGMPKQFKLKSLNEANSHSKIEAECSNYMYDSFCVNDEDVIFLSSDDDSKAQKKSKNKRIGKVGGCCKKLKRIATYDTTTSSEYEKSPQNEKISSDAYVIDLTSNQDESLITTKKCKPNVLISSDEENDNFTFVKPVTVESRIPEITLSDVNKINTKTSAKDSSNMQKIEFSLDFFDNDVDFIPLSTTRKAQGGISMNVVKASENASKMYTNNFEVKSTNCDLKHKNVEKIYKVSSEMPSCSKALDSKQTKCAPEVDFISTNNITFDISWNEFTPCVSNNIKVSKNSVENNSVSESLNESKISVILVNSCELASGKPVISALRSMYNVNPVVMQLNSVDYVISNRVAVERILDSEFNNCAMPPRIIEKIKSMNEIYEKSVVIIEHDNRKHILSFNKNTTKYLQFTCYLNYHPSTKVLFSKSVENTSELISNLIMQERKRGFHINVPVTLNPKSQKLYDFYASFPKISPICALNFVYHFPTVELFSNSSVEDLKSRGCIPSHKAAKIFKYFRSELTHKNL